MDYYKTAWNLAATLPLEAAVRTYLESLSPPRNPGWLKVAMEAIDLASCDEREKLLSTLGGVPVTVSDLVEQLRLDGFVDYVRASKRDGANS